MNTFLFTGGPLDEGIYVSKELSQGDVHVSSIGGRFYLYRYDKVKNSMIYDKEVYMNYQGVVEYDACIDDEGHPS